MAVFSTKRSRGLSDSSYLPHERPLTKRRISEHSVTEEEQDQVSNFLGGTTTSVIRRETPTDAIFIPYEIPNAEPDAHDLTLHLSQVSAGVPATDAATAVTSTHDGLIRTQPSDPSISYDIQASPFAAIGAQLSRGRLSLNVSDTDLVNAVRKWPESPSDIHAIYAMARHLFIDIDHSGSQFPPFEDIERTFQSPDFLTNVVDQLCPSTKKAHTKGRRMSRCPLLDPIGRKKRFLLASVLESTRVCRISSPVERVVMFWSAYRLFSFLVFPTAQNLTRCPQWSRPLPAQYFFAHPPWVDWVPWPMVRDRLVHTWASYSMTDFWSSFLTDFRLSVPEEHLNTQLISVNETGTDLVLLPGFETWLDDINNFAMMPHFCQLYPELSHCVRQEPSQTATSQTSQSVTVLTPTAVEDCGSGSLDSGVDTSCGGNMTLLYPEVQPPTGVDTEFLFDWSYTEADSHSTPDLLDPFVSSEWARETHMMFSTATFT